MSGTPDRVGELIGAWVRATDRHAPTFTARSHQRGPTLRTVVLVGLALILIVGIVVGTLAVGGFFSRAAVIRPPAEVVRLTSDAIATAPGVSYRLSIETDQPDGILGIDSSGQIDLRSHHFKGDAGSGPGPVMLLFGGPRSGSAVMADDLFIKTEDGPFEAVPIENAAQLRPFLDPATLSRAFASTIDGAHIDPVVRTTPCGASTCQIIGLEIPARATSDLTALMLGGAGQPSPSDLQPIEAELWVDPQTGFPAHLAARIVAGTTTTRVVLDLERLDPPPTIVAPSR